MQDGPYGPGRQMLVQTEQGNIIAVWLNVHLEKQLRVQEAETGDVVAIWYGGQARSNSALRKSKIAP